MVDDLRTFADEQSKAMTLLLGRPVRILDEGSHKPVLFGMENAEGRPCGEWVVKPPCSFADGVSAVLRELVAAQLAARLGVLTPRFGLVRLPNRSLRLDSSKVGEHVAGWLAKDAGKVAFCSRYVDGINFSRLRLNRAGRPKQAMARDCVFVVLFDVLCRNYDRTNINPNLIDCEERIVSIDFDCAFYHAEGIDDTGCSLESSGFTNWAKMSEHPLWPFLARETGAEAWGEFEKRVMALSDHELDEMAAEWPAELDIGRNREFTGLRHLLRTLIGDRVKNISVLIQEVHRAVSRG